MSDVAQHSISFDYSDQEEEEENPYSLNGVHELECRVGDGTNGVSQREKVENPGRLFPFSEEDVRIADPPSSKRLLDGEY